MIDLWTELIGQLGAVPALEGARCRQRWELFDATISGPRAWLDSLPESRRPLGVTAGQIGGAE